MTGVRWEDVFNSKTQIVPKKLHEVKKNYFFFKNLFFLEKKPLFLPKK